MPSAQVAVINGSNNMLPKPSPIGHFLTKLGARRNKSAKDALVNVSRDVASKQFISKENSKKAKLDNRSDMRKDVSPLARIAYRLSINRKQDRFLVRQTSSHSGLQNRSHEISPSMDCPTLPYLNDSAHISSRSAVSENDLRLAALRKEEDLTDFWPQACVSLSQSEYNLQSSRRSPSYIRLSCALNGYSQFTKFPSGANASSSKFPMPLGLVERKTLILKEIISANENPIATTKIGHDSECNRNLGATPVKQLVERFDTKQIEERELKSIKDNKENKAMDSNKCDELVEFDASKTLDKVLKSSIPLTQQAPNNVETDTTPQPIFAHSIHSALCEKLVPEENQPNTSNQSQVFVSNYTAETAVANEIRNLGVSDVELPCGNDYKESLSKVREVLEKKSNDAYSILESQERTLPEYASDMLRIAAGKTKLLLSNKMMKFAELVEKNLNPTEDVHSTTVDDLSGYWALIRLELSEIERIFDKIDEMRRNGWKKPIEKIGESPEKTINIHKNHSGKAIPIKGSPERAEVTEKRRKAIAEAKQKQKDLLAKASSLVQIDGESSVKLIL